jgi:hypothetical protein
VQALNIGSAFQLLGYFLPVLGLILEDCILEDLVLLRGPVALAQELASVPLSLVFFINRAFFILLPSKREGCLL